MAPIIPVQALPLPVITRWLQQLMAKNKSKLEKAGIWEFLLRVHNVDKVVQEEKVTRFVHTYHLQKKTARVAETIVDFSTTRLPRFSNNLPSTGLTLATLPSLSKTKAQEIFERKINWAKDHKWNMEGVWHHCKGWLEFVNTYLLFRPKEYRMDHKFAMATICTWEGVKVNWALMVQT